ncbi:glucosamine inositolphosphorylceramide transferase family protein [Flavobacterium luteum]|uniref:Glucosamine inositolphosphorylceramide transferase 1 N-terminal domain-containing protein n=1 Tax=Flavobacterium luteum TaxID=2026654 RepID=A0A7J5AKB2_9FLAO|nr:hypothetical protein [Flavobacterium luteum]KAB1158044.1 hypothetical protein F6464_02890 [Flavobacterium luteum]
MKKILLSIFILTFILLVVFNYRIPFLKQNGGPWSIGFGESNTFPENISVEKNGKYPLEQLKIFDDNTKFLADPFFLKVKDTFYLFFEHKKIENHAEIGLLTSTDGKNYKYRGTALKEKFHLSYPQVFEYQKNYYMIPESQGSNHVLLYKASRFPFGWKVCDTLLKNIKLKDPTIYISDTLNIMLATDDKLTMYMYQADSLFGKWKLHKKSKVIMGSESRCGGRIFANKKGLIVPIQNSSNGYGFGVSLYNLTFKNGDYTIKRVKPFFLKRHKNIKEFNAGMHQLDIQRIDNKYYCVYDGNRLVNAEKKINIKGSLKMNYYDVKNWLYQNLN